MGTTPIYGLGCTRPAAVGADRTHRTLTGRRQSMETQRNLAKT